MHQKVDKALKERYKNIIYDGCNDEAVYRDSNTGDLVSFSCSGSVGGGDGLEICASATSFDLSRKVFAGGVKIWYGYKEDDHYIDMNKMSNELRGLQDLSAEVRGSHGAIYWDARTKGLIKISLGDNREIPDCIVSTTKGINGEEVLEYLKGYLNKNNIRGGGE